MLSCKQAKAVSNDFQNWSLTTLEGNFPNKKFGYYLELQNRLRDKWSDQSLFILRPALKYNLNDSISLYQGYDWFTTFNDEFRVEHRLWQQILVKKKFFKDLSTFMWFRLEERFLPNMDETGLRGRLRAGFRKPLFNSKKLSLDFFDEFFFNFFSNSSGPRAGFDQNWVFTGLNYQFNDKVGLQTGYLINMLNRDELELQHAFRTTLHFHF